MHLYISFRHEHLHLQCYMLLVITKLYGRNSQHTYRFSSKANCQYFILYADFQLCLENIFQM